jgi:hypothetical protein
MITFIRRNLGYIAVFCFLCAFALYDLTIAYQNAVEEDVLDNKMNAIVDLTMIKVLCDQYYDLKDKEHKAGDNIETDTDKEAEKICTEINGPHVPPGDPV